MESERNSPQNGALLQIKYVTRRRDFFFTFSFGREIRRTPNTENAYILANLETPQIFHTKATNNADVQENRNLLNLILTVSFNLLKLF